MCKDKKIILASSSPRRQNFLKALGIDFSIRKPDVEECYPADLKAEQIALFLSKLKADSIPLEDNEIIISADTVVWVDNESLAKPKDREEAIKMLKKLSAKEHQVFTGVTIKSKQKSDSFFCRTNVFFKELSDKEINFYVDNFSPYDKAGSYAIQEWIGVVGIEKIEGSITNVIGLPMTELQLKLQQFCNL